MKTGKSNNTLYGIAAFAAIVLFFGIASLGDKQPDYRFTVYSKFENGLMAIHKTLNDSGIKTIVWKAPIDQTLPDGTLFIIAPVNNPGIEEIDELQKWVAKGNTLIVSFDKKNNSPFMKSKSSEKAKKSSAVPLNKTALSQGVASLKFSESIEKVPLIWKFHYLARYNNDYVDDSEQESERFKRLNTAKNLFHIFAVDETPVVGVADYGKGRVIAVSIPTCFSNSCIGNAGNAGFVLNSIQQNNTSEPYVIFYEYGNDFFRMIPGSGIASMIKNREAKLGIGILLSAIVLFLFESAVRFGSVKKLRENTRFRSEYLSSLSNLLQMGNGTDVVLDDLGSKFMNDITRFLHLSATGRIDLIVDTAKDKGFEKSERLRDALTEASKKHTPVPNEIALNQAREWDRLRKEISELR